MMAVVRAIDGMPSHKKTVSVAAIFKRQARTTAKPDQPIRKALKESVISSKKNSKHAKQVETRSSPRSTRSRVSKKRGSSTSLEVSFKETSNNYRRHLYHVANTRINNTLNTQLQILNDNKLQAISSDDRDPDQSPLKLTIPTKFEREANKIYQPLSNYKICMTHTDTDGNRQSIVGTLEQRMVDYEDYLKRQKKEITKLAQEWETIVGEIWKLGVSVLGEEAMETLLFTERKTQNPPSTAGAESTLFIPEDEELSQQPSDRKRVKFDAQVRAKLSHAEHLGFLYQPTKIQNKPPTIVRARSQQDNDELNKSVASLGKKHFADMQAAQQEYQKYWQKKRAQITLALRD